MALPGYGPLESLPWWVPWGTGGLEVSGCGKVKVKPRTAGKATQRACPTDPQSAAA